MLRANTWSSLGLVRGAPALRLLDPPAQSPNLGPQDLDPKESVKRMAPVWLYLKALGYSFCALEGVQADPSR